ncbi:hypothetical protein Poli38472_007036 [Pythium oligandrum]|uniref:Nudix hydrolase domain-containing protein n=1 Tax=Pythium oligandrum TaxID=41045 RepID=A0A8K1FDZ5_PYTOL|nr:hypothetical protein Poli38472_007036 [Pythium oligandrum]|eukprot:TMW58891.1 hypothetical protein Poli38472_007036 [Pythium oligandrum]
MSTEQGDESGVAPYGAAVREHAAATLPLHTTTGHGDVGEEHISPLQHSRVGRANQRYDGATRLLACVVVVRPAPDAGSAVSTPSSRQVLLISSSKHPDEWILPKGGWEDDESIEECAHREAEEEAGVTGSIVSDLGQLDFATHKGSPCRLYGFVLQCERQYAHWAESSRRRKWVSFEEAHTFLQKRSELLHMLRRAQQADGADEA